MHDNNNPTSFSSNVSIKICRLNVDCYHALSEERCYSSRAINEFYDLMIPSCQQHNGINIFIYYTKSSDKELAMFFFS